MNAEDVEDLFPLAPAQQGMLYHALLEPDAGLYVVQLVIRLPAGADLEALRRAWEGLCERHAALRAGISWKARAEPLHVVLRRVQVPFVVDDWSHLAPDEADSALKALLAADRRRGFELARGPLLRVRVLKTADGAHRMVSTVHHLVVDGWSQGILLRDLSALYAAATSGGPVSLPSPPPLREYSAWLGQQQSSAGRARAHFAELLSGFDAPDAPADFGELRVLLPAETTARLRAVASRSRVTLNVLAQAVWATVLSRYSGQRRVLFGSTFSGRSAPLSGIEEMVGCLINTLPVVAEVDPNAPLSVLLKKLQQQLLATAEFEWASQVEVQRASAIPQGQPLFESLFDSTHVAEAAPAAELSLTDGVELSDERTNYALTLFASGSAQLELLLSHDRRRFDDAAIHRLSGHLSTVFEAVAQGGDPLLGALPLVDPGERDQLRRWNETRRAQRGPQLIHAQVEAQAGRTPSAPAVSALGKTLTYRELDRRANAVARRLRALGVGPEKVVGVCMERTVELLVALLGVLKAGAAYLPLDPTYPQARLQYMAQDAGVRVVLSQKRLGGWLRQWLPGEDLTVLTLDDASSAVEVEERPEGVTCSPSNAAYVLYTSGSSGKPKGVAVQHGSVCNFFSALDERIGLEGSRVFFAVTSISFDISVLELFWSLSRGFHVLLFAGSGADLLTARAPGHRPPDFGLYYFAAEDGLARTDRYRLLLEGARFADEHGFAAVWTPERHFHAFGGMYPNPSVVSAALAAVTKKVRLRAGSVVSPLHDPIRIAEEWSVVDNLSGGRVGISFASGWHPEDFVLAPDRYADRRNRMLDDISAVQTLWRGGALTRRGPDGRELQVSIRPRPVQAELPVWLTTTGSPETFEQAGALGAGVLTHLLGQNLDALPGLIDRYRRARQRAGHPGPGHVTLMVHAYLDRTVERAREIAREPFAQYLQRSHDLLKRWTASLGESDGLTLDDPEAVDRVIRRAVDRYLHTAGLFGTPESCLEMVDRIGRTGVDEIACLIDFGIPDDTVLEGLEYLALLRERTRPGVDHSLSAALRAQQGGYLQCTPSLAKALTEQEDHVAFLRPLSRLLVGGEALPQPLAQTLAATVGGKVFNMYGPTETTIWSSVQGVERGAPRVTLGQPLWNTELHVLDSAGQLAPVGVPGELYIGGEGLARGYLGHPELTAERFVPDPFSGLPGTRLYRTGDLVRRLPSGELEFLGRRDQQVKVRGQRLELGEIEATLLSHPAVKDAAVALRGAPGEPKLVGYVVPRSEAPEAAQLRAFLAARLPEVMVPHTVVTLSALPLTPNGKLDRKALPAPTSEGDRRTPVAPATPTEAALLRLWTKALGRPSIGVEDDYFELGGDSLMTLRLAALAAREGLPVTPRLIVLHPTLRQLARVVDGTSPPTAKRTGPGLPLTPAQLLRGAGTPWVKGRAQACLRALPRPNDLAPLTAALGLLAARHPVLGWRVRGEAPGAFSEQGPPPAQVPVDRLSVERSAPVGAAVSAALKACSFDQGPLRAAVLDPAGGEHAYLLLMGDPLLLDGRSVERLADLVLRLCGEPALAPAPEEEEKKPSETLQALVRDAQGPERTAELSHWLKTCAPPLGFLPLTSPDDSWRGGPSATLGAFLPVAPGGADPASRSPERAAEVVAAALSLAIEPLVGAGGWVLDWLAPNDSVEAPWGAAIGPFQAPHPIRIELTGPPDRRVSKVRGALAAVPRGGHGYALLRHLGTPAAQERLAAAGKAQVLLRVQATSGFQAPPDALVALLDAEVPTHPLQVTVQLSKDGLHLAFTYAVAALERGLVERLLEATVARFGELTGRPERGPRAEEFPDTGLPPAQLERLLGTVGKRGRSG